jgi:Carboxypeptidase regulatory-like domain/SdrD B-like domain
MKRLAAVLLACAMFAPGGAVAQSMLTVAYDKTITLNVPGATSAYAVNPLVAEAGVTDGAVQIRGTGGGTTTVVVVTPGGTQTVTVTVTVPALSAALGAAGAGAGGAGPGAGAEGGYYLGGYNSGAGQVTNAISLHDRQGQTSRQLTLVAATYVSPANSDVPGSTSGTGFPLVSYTVSRPGESVTYLDQSVNTSPLTFNSALVRGIHIQDGQWIFHAGASSIAGFGQYFVLTDPQWMAGVTRGFILSRSSSLAANIYDIVNPRDSTQFNAPGGVLGTLLYTYHPQPHFIVQAEAGLSHAVGFSGSAVYDDKATHVDASLVDKPPTFASLATDNQQGVIGTFDYSRAFNAALDVDAGAQRTDYTLPAFREDSQTAQGTVNYRLNSNLTLSGGGIYSDIDSTFPIAFQQRTLSFPFTLGFSTRHFNASLLYQPTSDFSGTLATGYGATIGTNQGPFSLSGFYNHNVDIPAVSSIFSQVPGLQAALEQAGINVNDPSQLAALLDNAALLASLGFKGLTIDIAPAQNVFGLNAAWTQPKSARQQFNLNFVGSNSQLSNGGLNFRIATFGYSRRLSVADDLNASVSWFDTTNTSSLYDPAAAASTSFASHSSQITYGVQIRHRFGSVPAFLFPSRRGTIDGYVFQDDDASGRFDKGDAGLGNVEVVLDGNRTARTDASGHYSFGGVPYGTHQVAPNVTGSKPFYFTTDSPATATIGSKVDFGVSFVQGKIFGYVTNDAGQGLGGVDVQISGLNKHVTTEEDGRFIVAGVPAGHYTVSVGAESLPAGYDLSSASPAPVTVSASAPWPVNLSVKALRSITGTVSDYNPALGTLKPAIGITVAIPKLGISATTDANGVYTLRDLPAGTYAIEVDGGTESERQTVVMPSDPTTMTGINFRVTVRQADRARLRQGRRS